MSLRVFSAHAPRAQRMLAKRGDVLEAPNLDAAPLVEVIQKWDPSQPRDSSGKWTSEGVGASSEAKLAEPAAAHIESDARAVADASGGAPSVKNAVHATVAAALSTLHNRVKAQAAKARRVVTSTRLHDFQPTTAGGFQITASHATDSPHSHILSSIQVNPFHTMGLPGRVGLGTTALVRTMGQLAHHLGGETIGARQNYFDWTHRNGRQPASPLD